jgi:hypothetical protein
MHGHSLLTRGLEKNHFVLPLEPKLTVQNPPNSSTLEVKLPDIALVLVKNPTKTMR